ncbi:MAG TPA: SDR family oxidoreductase [Gemmatimonadaceae bacterium]|nr:SDR family oxidoreductase [Gemmatimonadaceae bacterium]
MSGAGGGEAGSPTTSPARPIALVTGASAGIGREFATQLARGGYDLVLVARDEGRLRALAGELRERFGAASEVLTADLSRDDDTARVVARIDAAPVDLVVNNAGFGTRGTLASTPREPQEAMLRVHVLAVHRLAQAAVQQMVPRGRGAIINVSSVASFITSPGNVNYCATKAWQRIYSEALSQELAGRGVYVQALCPGFTHSEFHARGRMDKTRYPGWWWMPAERVVAVSLAALARRAPVVVIPGTGYRLAAFLLRHLPLGLRLRLAGRYRRDRPAGPPREPAPVTSGHDGDRGAQ